MSDARMSSTLTRASLRVRDGVSRYVSRRVGTTKYWESRCLVNRTRGTQQRTMKQQREASHTATGTPLPGHGNSGRIHILGIGNIGKLFAHAMAIKSMPPPITLLFHRSDLLSAWEEAGRSIEIVTNGVGAGGGSFDVEIIQATAHEGDGPQGSIENLIVTTKAASTAAAIDAVKHRLTPSSAILFTQNGMGTVEEVSSIVFPDPALRPRYLACVTSHGIFSQGPFSAVHAGHGTVAIGSVICQQSHQRESLSHRDANNPPYLVREMVGAPLLAAREVSPVELNRLQLEKLVVNAMINPLTVIFNRRNGELFTNPDIVRIMRLLLAEASQIICSLPELQGDPTTPDSFSVERLEGIIHDVAHKTAKNISSMLQDVRAGRQTEIDYINGYLVRRGQEVGVGCRNNEKLVQLVRDARTISEDEIELIFPNYV